MKVSLLAATLVLAGTASAQQMSGSYTINPAGSGNRVFKTFLEASKNLFFYGINGPVTIFVAPGVYKEEFFILPIEGASATNTITFRAQIPVGNTVKLESVNANGIIATMFPGVPALKNGFYVFDNLVWQKGDIALQAGGLTENVVIRNCIFEAGFTNSSRGAIYCEGANTALSWELYDNTFRVAAGRKAIYGSQIGQWSIFRNVFDLTDGTGAGEAIYLINNNNSQNDIFNNLFYGSMRSATTGCIAVNLSNINNEIVHNTILLEQGAGIRTFGTTSNYNKIFGNVIHIKGAGTCIDVSNTGTLENWASDGNCLYAPNGNIGMIGTTSYNTLAAWQAVPNTNQPERDKNSISVDPQLMSIVAPYDLRVKSGSPVQDAAVNTPAFVMQDYDGRYRDGKPDIGAFELNGFAVFGDSCQGTGNKAPVLGSTGTVKLGGVFQVTCSNGPASAPAVLAFGLSAQNFSGVPLPLDIGGKCSIYVSLDVLTPALLDAQGAVSNPIPVPPLPGLVGVEFFYQYFVIDGGSGSALGVTSTNGGSANI